MMEIRTLLIILSCSQLSISESLFEDPCGDWIAYKDEKCLKIYDQNVATYTDAENICKNEDGALLPTINNEEKQQFLENLLKSQKVVDNVWIGLRFVNESYIWEDGTVADYTHWTSGNPNNDPTYCVQLETEENVFGFWTNVACTKKNLVICEKLQLWSLSKLQSTVMNMIRNPVPIGFIYVQLPKEKPPQEVWPGVKWEDISSDYAGLFFRTEGGDSASFGEIQQESSPRLAKVKEHYDEGYNIEISVPSDGEKSPIIFTGQNYDNAYHPAYGLSFQLSKEKVCPLNTAIRIWKRL